ncbi:MAG TPA: 2-dehydropantoate 2-reductase [Polyangiaceae bacterium]|nr:2-dehydropantoate 2-reductase [Polyangiaceae bacterium]
MKVCIVGAGAIGGMLAVKLARTGAVVSVVARGAPLEAIRSRGLTLVEEDQTEHTVQIAASSALADLGQQDIVVLGMKAHQVAAVAPDLHHLLAPDTRVVTTQNGVPWWYFAKLDGPYAGQRLESVDPGGIIAAHIDIERVIACIAYPAAEIASPGVIRHIEGNRFSLGELDGTRSPRLRELSERLQAAGLRAPLSSDIRSEIWLKLWGNCSFNPISALTHATLADICNDQLTERLAANVMREAQAIGNALGVRFLVSLEKRIAGARAVGQHKTSTLQDVEAGRPLELEALVGAVIELGRITRVPTPHLDVLYACTSLLAKTLERQKGRLRVETLAS